MKIPLKYIGLGIFLVLICAGIGFVATAEALPKKVELAVPYASQAPYGNWKAPWNEACEETSTAMIEAYYLQKETLTTEETKKFVEPIFAWEEEHFGLKEDTTAAQTAEFIAAHASFEAVVQKNPSVKEIKQELANGNPVIGLVNMYQLYGEKNEGDSYHVFVITGYNDDKQVFIINDPARAKKEYSYTTMMKALHDFNPKSKEADGTPTVLFTKS